MTEYQQKLRDPRWQKKRLQILERDNWTCQKCTDTEATLVVHHRRYCGKTDPWDYDDYDLVTLCEPCHKEEYATWAEAEDTLILGAKLRLWSTDAWGLGHSIRCMRTELPSVLIMELVSWLLKDVSAQQLLTRAYEQHFDRELR